MSGALQTRVAAIIGRELKLDAAAVTEDISMENAELWDSVAHTEIVFALEKEFGIEFTQEETEEIYSFSEIIAVLERKGVAASA